MATFSARIHITASVRLGDLAKEMRPPTWCILVFSAETPLTRSAISRLLNLWQFILSVWLQVRWLKFETLKSYLMGFLFNGGSTLDVSVVLRMGAPKVMLMAGIKPSNYSITCYADSDWCCEAPAFEYAEPEDMTKPEPEGDRVNPNKWNGIRSMFAVWREVGGNK